MEVYWAEVGAEVRGEGCPESMSTEIMGRHPADSGQLSLDPASGLALPLPPPRVQHGSPDPISGAVLAHFFSLRSFHGRAPAPPCGTATPPGLSLGKEGQERGCAASGEPPAILAARG